MRILTIFHFARLAFMHLKPRTLSLLILLLLSLLPASPASAQDAVRIILNRAVQSSTQKVVFTLQAAGPATFDRLTITYGLSGHGCDAKGARMGIYLTPGKQVAATWEWDLKKDGMLLPGVELWWQFELHDESGQTTTTDRQTLLVMDLRHQWLKLAEGPVTLYWYQGSPSFGRRLMDIASSSLARLAETTGVKPTSPIRIIIYPTTDDMHEILRYVDEWAGGVTFGEYDLIIAGVGPQSSASWAEDVIPHELTHVITENGFINCESVRLPRWLVEGIAMHTTGPVTWAQRSQVKASLEKEALPELKSLRYNFPAGSEEANLAYAQSAMVVTYMVETGGADKINRLVESIRSGQTIDQSLRSIYGFNTAELDQAWRAGLGYGSAPEPNFITETPAPTRTPFATLALQVSDWKSSSSSETATPTATAAPTQTVTAPPPTATRTPIPQARPTQPAPAAPSSSPPQNEVPAYTPWLVLAGGIFLAIALVAGLAIWAIKRTA